MGLIKSGQYLTEQQASWIHMAALSSPHGWRVDWYNLSFGSPWAANE
jgi:hypothetical protein